MDALVKQKAETWLNGNYDEATKEEIRNMMKNNPDELVNSFYKDLEFGTGGLRGIMGVGSNKMNKYTVGAATQGLANYILKSFPGQKTSVAIAHDSRNNSRTFAEVVANVFSANGIKVYLFEALRPTPELSFAIRHLGCKSGVVLTASHNPKEYNGYKAYWDDGAQVVAPHDKNIITEVQAIKSVDEIKFKGNPSLIEPIGTAVDNAYLDRLAGLSVSPDAIKAQHDLKIVYTPIHGTGITLVPTILKKIGFTNVTIVQEQAEPNGNFPTVIYPNPEEAEALSMAVKKAKEIDADILLGTDPDADRVGIAVKNHKGEFQLLNGNQTGVLLFYYLLRSRKEKGKSTPKDYITKTIVTTYLIDRIAESYGVECYNTLTGFKFIASIMRENEGKKNFIAGAEESYGYLAGDFVRDKDAVGSVAMICEMAAYAKNNGKTLFDFLLDIYVQFGLYKEALVSLTKKGKSGADEIKQMMRDLRANPPSKIDGVELAELKDYENQVSRNLRTGKSEPITLPKSDVLQFVLADGSMISARPSGTEPKIKFYFSVKAPLASKAEYDKVSAQLDSKITAIVKDMGWDK